ncbi:GNAT family N-acetyltransferase [Acinetobacter sp. Marseille-Q1623]|uniref:GNAT family N-acetyltransferase n=1 Tax=Acinetobacter sp. Marseille-Q1623 TaxID=2697501 RepID=UPI00157ABEE6|nr:GNAT family N-acetyltransferase [Acinetobacter sp. Marseille-Q1623]
MFARLNQYRQNISFPLTRPKKAQLHYKFEWAEDIKQLKEIQKFRAEQFSQQFGIQFEHGLDQDLYDLDCHHAVLRDKWSDEIVAYTRLKLVQGDDLAHSYSAQEFDISQFSNLSNIVEIGRTCVHPRYRNGKALSILWLNLVPMVLWKMKAKHLMGCVSIRLEDNKARAYYTHQFIKKLDQSQTIHVPARPSYEPIHPEFSFPQDERIPKLFDVYLKMKARLSQQAYHDEQFNCLDYFVFLDVNEIAKHFVLNKMVNRS